MLFLKKITGDDTKKTKRSTEVQVLTKDFTSYNISYKSLGKTKLIVWYMDKTAKKVGPVSRQNKNI